MEFLGGPLWWLVLETWIRGLIGIAFVSISVQLFLMGWRLGNLIMLHTTRMFATFIGFCGIARCVSAIQCVMKLIGINHSLVINWCVIGFDLASAVVGLAAAITLIPLTLQIMGWAVFFDEQRGPLWTRLQQAARRGLSKLR